MMMTLTWPQEGQFNIEFFKRFDMGETPCPLSCIWMDLACPMVPHYPHTSPLPLPGHTSLVLLLTSAQWSGQPGRPAPRQPPLYGGATAPHRIRNCGVLGAWGPDVPMENSYIVAHLTSNGPRHMCHPVIPPYHPHFLRYLGQCTVHMKGKTECFECEPKVSISHTFKADGDKPL